MPGSLELECAQCGETYRPACERPEDHAPDCPVRGDLRETSDSGEGETDA